jgi:2-keto-4-pentenoate hydratase
MGHPFESVAWIANVLSRRDRSLRAGDIVLTGSIVETQWMSPGDSMDFAVEGLGAVTARFD